MTGQATVHPFFIEEAQSYVQRMTALLEAEGASAAPASLLELARGLRGMLQLARNDRALRGARLIEGAARGVLSGRLTLSDDVRDRFDRTLADVTAALGHEKDDDVLDRRIEEAENRWRVIEVRPWLPAAVADLAAQEPAGLDDEAFLSFAAGEIDGILTVLGESVDAFAEDGMNRDALANVLRRQRALLGAARLDELAVVAETLRAVEDVSRIIARMNVAIKDEWLDVFRCARLVLESSAEPLARGEDPPHTPALSRLRTYRQELIERYGSADDPAPAASAPAPVPAADGDAAGAAPVREKSSVDIQNLMYTGEAALRRALDLRARLERAVEHDPDALALVDEVFDLIRLGLQ